MDSSTLDAWSDAISNGNAQEVVVAMPTAVDAKGKPIRATRMTVAEMMEVYAHGTDGSTRAEMLSGDGIVLRSTPDAVINVGVRDLVAIERQLPAEAKAIVDSLKQFMNSGDFQQRFQATFLDMHGHELDTRPDYFPRTRAGSADDPNRAARQWLSGFMENFSIFQRRKRTGRAVMVGDFFETWLRHITKVSEYTGKQPAIHDMRGLVNEHGDFAKALRAGYRNGDKLVKELNQYVDEYEGLDKRPMSGFEKWLQGVIQKAHKGVLGLKPQIVAMQFVSWLNIFAEADAPDVFSGFRPSPNSLAEIDKWSPLLWMRITGRGHGILTPDVVGDLLQETLGRRGILERASLGPIHWMDTQVILRVWETAKSEMSKEGLQGDELMQRTADRALDIVDRTQPTWDVRTMSLLSRAGRRNPAFKLLSMFSSQRAKNFNMVFKAASQWMNGEIGTPELAKKVAIPTFVNAFLVFTIRDFFKRALTPERERDNVEDALAVVDNLLGNWLVAGPVISDLIRRVHSVASEGRPVWSLPRQNVVSSALHNLGSGVSTVWQGSQELASGERELRGARRGGRKGLTSISRGIERLFSGLSIFTGVPFQGMFKLAARGLRHKQVESEQNLLDHLGSLTTMPPMSVNAEEIAAGIDPMGKIDDWETRTKRAAKAVKSLGYKQKDIPKLWFLYQTKQLPFAASAGRIARNRSIMEMHLREALPE
jgi:hypothetical protein